MAVSQAQPSGAQDVAALRIRDFLLADSALAAQVGTRIWATRRRPAGYNVTPDPAKPLLTGPCILVYVRGGPRDDTRRVKQADVVFECYAATEWEALQLAEVHLFNALEGNGRRNRYVLSALEDSSPSVTREPGTDWPLAMVTYTIMVRML